MFANPLGLLALLAVPAIVALHLFRRRFQPREVSALFLWAEEDATPTSGRKREPFRASTSLVLECLAAIALALLLAGPKGCASEGSEHFVAVLDGSASMDARDASGESSAQRAVARVRERIASLPRGSRVTLVASGARPRTLAGPAAFPDEAGEALERYAPSLVHHDLEPALALAAQVAGRAAVVLFTDRFAPDEVPKDVELAGVGRALDNVAIVRASRDLERTEDGLRERVVVVVASFAQASARRELVLQAPDGRSLAEPRPLELAPNERRELAFTLPAGSGALEIALEADALAIDDRAFLAPVPPRVVRAFSTLADDASRALGLADASGSNVARLALVADEVESAASAAEAHLVFGSSASDAPQAWSVVLGASGEERKDFVGPFLFDRRHPLLDGVTFDGVVWSADPNAVLSGVPLVAAGNLPLATDDERERGRVIAFDLDPLRSTLARSPDWPILLANLVEMRRRELPGPVRANVALGEPLAFRADVDGASPEPFVLVGPSSRLEHAPRSTLVFEDLEAPGFHRIERAGTVLATFGVSFVDEHESDLRALGSGVRASALANARGEPTASPLEVLLLGMVAAFVCADWFVLRRANARLSDSTQAADRAGASA